MASFRGKEPPSEEPGWGLRSGRSRCMMPSEMKEAFMGGIGSGARRSTHIGNVEEMLALDVRVLRRLGVVRPGECTCDTVLWSIGGLSPSSARLRSISPTLNLAAPWRSPAICPMVPSTSASPSKWCHHRSAAIVAILSARSRHGAAKSSTMPQAGSARERHSG